MNIWVDYPMVVKQIRPGVTEYSKHSFASQEDFIEAYEAKFGITVEMFRDASVITRFSTEEWKKARLVWHKEDSQWYEDIV